MTKGRFISIVVLILVVLAGLWGYGFVGAKVGWVKVTDLDGMNPVTRNGVDCAGGIGTLFKTSVGL